MKPTLFTNKVTNTPFLPNTVDAVNFGYNDYTCYCENGPYNQMSLLEITTSATQMSLQPEMAVKTERFHHFCQNQVQLTCLNNPVLYVNM